MIAVEVIYIVVSCTKNAGSLQQSAVVAFRDVRSNRSILAESP